MDGSIHIQESRRGVNGEKKTLIKVQSDVVSEDSEHAGLCCVFAGLH